MKTIPVEILIWIFRLLHPRDKLQYMVVCHEWESVIKSSVLLEALRVTTMHSLNSVLSKVQQDPIYGTKVKRLLFQVVLSDIFDIYLIPKLFLNVHDFHVDPNLRVSLHFTPFHPWHTNLKRFFDGDDDDLRMRMVLGSNLLSNLVILELDGEEDDYSTKDTLRMLASAPALKNLTLKITTFAMDDLETLHDTLPLLNSLSLKNMGYNDRKLLIDIVPALLTSLSIECSPSIKVEPERVLYRYISQKYSNVSNLSITSEKNNSHHSNIHDVFHDEWDAILTKLAPRLKKLELQPSSFEDNYVLQTLDKKNCQLKSLCLPSGSTIKEKQAGYLKSLKLKDVPSGFNGLSSMKMLTELSINFALVLRIRAVCTLTAS